MPTTVLFLGATGYIGGSVLARLIKEYPDVVFKALVRSDATVPAVAATGAIVIKDEMKDHDAITEHVYQADIVFNCTDSRDVPLNDAILKGFKKRFDQGKGVGSLIHTSGAANFMDGTGKGKYDPTTKEWTDAEDDIKQLTGNHMHGKVDTAILKAGNEGYVNTFIVCPSAVFGKGNGPVKTFNPYLVKLYTSKGKGIYIGEGSNIINLNHINDLVEAYYLVFKKAFSSEGKFLPESSYTHYYLVVNNTMTWKTIANTYSKALFERGKVSKPEAESLSVEDAGPFAMAMGSNMKVRSVQLKGLGWEPKFNIVEESLIEGLDEGLATMNM